MVEGRGRKGGLPILTGESRSGSEGGRKGEGQGEELGLGHPGTYFSSLSTAHSFA